MLSIPSRAHDVRENVARVSVESLFANPWSSQCFTHYTNTHALHTDCSSPCFAGTSRQDPKGKGKALKETPSKPGYYREGKWILEDQQKNPNLHRIVERERENLDHEQLLNRTVLFY